MNKNMFLSMMCASFFVFSVAAMEPGEENKNSSQEKGVELREIVCQEVVETPMPVQKEKKEHGCLACLKYFFVDEPKGCIKESCNEGTPMGSAILLGFVGGTVFSMITAFAASPLGKFFSDKTYGDIYKQFKPNTTQE